MNERELAIQLTEFLVKPERGSYGTPGNSPLATYVETEIKAICRTIAAEAVKAHPELTGAIRRRIEEAIRQALATDNYLNRLVSEAVAKQLTDITLERRTEE